MKLPVGKWEYLIPPLADRKSTTVDHPVLLFRDERLLSQNASENYSPLMMALWNGSRESYIVNSLIRNGASHNYRSSKFGYTPLDILFLTPNITYDKKHLRIKEFLLKKAPAGRSLVPHLITSDSDHLVQNKMALLNQLNEQNIDFTYKEKTTRNSIMHLAIKTGEATIVNWVLAKIKLETSFSNNFTYDLLTETNQYEQCSIKRH